MILINLFLDTTPRQWFNKFVGLLRLFRDFNFAAIIDRWLMVSVILHGILFLSVWQFSDGSIPAAPSTEYSIEFRPLNSVHSSEVDAVYDDSSDVVVAVPKKEKSRSRNFAEKLLERYKNISLHGGAKMDQANEDRKRPVWRKEPPLYRDEYRRGRVDLAKSLTRARLDAPINEVSLSKDQLIQHLSRYQGMFQACYEAALLKDESLNGKVHFEIRTGSAGAIVGSKVTFEGVGLVQTKGELQDCLKNLIGTIRFPNTLAAVYNRTLQFQAVLSL